VYFQPWQPSGKTISFEEIANLPDDVRVLYRETEGGRGFVMLVPREGEKNNGRAVANRKSNELIERYWFWRILCKMA
jgi:hypothetical protein